MFYLRLSTADPVEIYTEAEFYTNFLSSNDLIWSVKLTFFEGFLPGERLFN